MAGNLNSDSVIWVIDATASGINAQGVAAAIPTSNANSADATQVELDAFEARIVASGVLPNTNF